MAVYVCEVCGAEFQDDTLRYRRFCSKNCSNKAHVQRYRDREYNKPPEEVPCHYNETVFCTNTKLCNSCGWNPEVAEARREKILKRMGVVMP